MVMAAYILFMVIFLVWVQIIILIVAFMLYISSDSRPRLAIFGQWRGRNDVPILVYAQHV